MSGRIALLGPGDLGTRIAIELARCAEVEEIICASRLLTGQQLPFLLDVCYQKAARHVLLDVSDSLSVEHFLRRERPDIVVHCASLLSPWYLVQSKSKVAPLLLSAGFAAQLPAQLSLIRKVMQAVEETGFSGPVVNCSYPDVTNAVLGRHLIAPTVGIGNVSMIRRLVMATMRHHECVPRKGTLVRVVGHHSQVCSSICSGGDTDDFLRPMVFLGAEGERVDDFLPSPVRLPNDIRLNALSALTAVEVILSLLPGSTGVRTSAPGPLGLQGGYPIWVDNQTIKLDLPEQLPFEECTVFQEKAALIDGIGGIDSDGTVFFTPRTESILASCDTRLAAPLNPGKCEERFDVLKQYL